MVGKHGDTPGSNVCNAGAGWQRSCAAAAAAAAAAATASLPPNPPVFRCSHKYTPCHVPNANCPLVIGMFSEAPMIVLLT